MGYYEGNISDLSTGNNGMWGGDGIWAILLLALLGNRGFGFGGGYSGGSGYEGLGWQMGRLATTNDVASGFAQNTLQRGIDDILLSQTQGFAGLNTAISNATSTTNYNMLQGFHGVDNAICNLGYNLTHQISDCCCGLKGAIADVKYAGERNTCDIIQAINANSQRVIDYMTSEKIDSLNRKLTVAEGQLSNYAQTNAIISALAPKQAIPAYNVPNPNCCYSTCTSIQ